MATKKFNFGIFIDGEPVTGSSDVYCQIMKVSNNTYLDWVGNTFGATGTPKVMTEISSTYFPGYYQASIDIAGWADGEYLISTYYDDGVDEAYSIDSMIVANGAEVNVNTNSLVGTPVDMGDGATISQMLTAIGGASFSKATDSLKIISDNVDTVDGVVDGIDTAVGNLNDITVADILDHVVTDHTTTNTVGLAINSIGSPLGWGSGPNTLANMLSYMGDQYGGSTFDPAYDSLQQIRMAGIQDGCNTALTNYTVPTVDDIWDEPLTDHIGARSASEFIKGSMGEVSLTPRSLIKDTSPTMFVRLDTPSGVSVTGLDQNSVSIFAYKNAVGPTPTTPGDVALSEISSGIYGVTLNSALGHTDTIGSLALLFVYNDGLGIRYKIYEYSVVEDTASPVEVSTGVEVITGMISNLNDVSTEEIQGIVNTDTQIITGSISAIDLTTSLENYGTAKGTDVDTAVLTITGAISSLNDISAEDVWNVDLSGYITDPTLAGTMVNLGQGVFRTTLTANHPEIGAFNIADPCPDISLYVGSTVRAFFIDKNTGAVTSNTITGGGGLTLYPGLGPYPTNVGDIILIPFPQKSGGVTALGYTDVGDAVWDAETTSHFDSGSMGEQLKYARTNTIVNEGYVFIKDSTSATVLLLLDEEYGKPVTGLVVGDMTIYLIKNVNTIIPITPGDIPITEITPGLYTATFSGASGHLDTVGSLELSINYGNRSKIFRFNVIDTPATASDLHIYSSGD